VCIFWSERSVKRFLQVRNNSYNWATPERGRRFIVPARIRRVENRVVPVESFLKTAAWGGPRGLSLRELIQFAGHHVFRIPELPRPRI